MRDIILKHSLKAGIAAFLISISKNSFAQSGQSSGNDDTALLLILIGFILVLAIVIGILGNTIRSIAGNKDLWKDKFNKSAMILMMMGLFSLLPQNASASNLLTYVMTNEVFYLLVGLIILLFIIAVMLSSTLKGLLRELSEEEEEASFISQLTENLTEAVPVEREEEVLTDHEYDGIRELDNVLPPWWVYLFYVTIIFSVVYMIRYHVVGSGNVMAEEYQAEMLEAEKVQEAMAEANPGMAISEENVERLTENSEIERGKVIFNANCATCHLETGGGDNGPNLTDQYWIHGGSIKDIFTTIKYGVSGKMIAWETMIKPDDMQRVASYVMTLQGTNPPNGKEPQGELYVPMEEEEAPADSTQVDTAEPDTTAMEE